MTSFLSSYIYAKDHIFRFFSLATLKFVWSQFPFKITDENNFTRFRPCHNISVFKGRLQLHQYQERYVIMKARMSLETNLWNKVRTLITMFMLENEVHSFRKSCSRSVPHFGCVEGVGRKSWVFPGGL